MVHNITASFATEILKDTNILGQYWIIPAIITLLICVLITRDPQKMGTLSFPVSVGLACLEMKVHALQLLATGVLFFLTTLSIETITELFAKTTETIRQIPEYSWKRKKQEYAQDKKITDKILSNPRNAWTRAPEKTPMSTDGYIPIRAPAKIHKPRIIDDLDREEESAKRQVISHRQRNMLKKLRKDQEEELNRQRRETGGLETF